MFRDIVMGEDRVRKREGMKNTRSKIFIKFYSRDDRLGQLDREAKL